jgi:hypothetical protein
VSSDRHDAGGRRAELPRRAHSRRRRSLWANPTRCTARGEFVQKATAEHPAIWDVLANSVPCKTAIPFAIEYGNQCIVKGCPMGHERFYGFRCTSEGGVTCESRQYSRIQFTLPFADL